MATERLGKIEKWILRHAYLKTVKHQLPEGWKIPGRVGHRLERLKELGEPCDLSAVLYGRDLQLFWDHLFKSEVLLNYFNLKRSGYKTPDTFASEYFEGYGDIIYGYDWGQEHLRNNAVVKFTRVKNQLLRKGLVEIGYDFGNNSCGITLTEKGQQKAEALLNVNARSSINIKDL
jgi:hypothetical protein